MVSILLQRGVIPAPDSAGRLSPPVGGHGQLACDSGMHGSYLLNTKRQNIVQCAAAQRAVSTADVLKMTQAEDGDLQFHPTVYGTNCQLACFNAGGCTGWEIPMRSAPAVTTALILVGIGAAEAADPTLLAETGGFLLGNAHRCGVAVERVERA
jgi:hypothetical protein